LQPGVRMIDRLLEIAPAATWIRVNIAGLLYLLAFVSLSHALTRRKAYGDEWQGLTDSGWYSRTLRWGVALLLAATALFLWELLG